MEKYLKIGDLFDGVIGFSVRHTNEQVMAGTHAINSHDELVAMNKELLAALEGLVGIVDDSNGVSGYHLNGDIADWGEFEEIEMARDVITKAKDAS